MNMELEQHCKNEIKDLDTKGLIVKSRSPWSCAAFYVNKNSEIERGTPRLVINYKPLNKALKWIRYLIPNKNDLSLQRIGSQLQKDFIQRKISDFKDLIEKEICADLPSAFWNRKQHLVDLPYENSFDERQIPTKARPIQMNIELK